MNSSRPASLSRSRRPPTSPRDATPNPRSANPRRAGSRSRRFASNPRRAGSCSLVVLDIPRSFSGVSQPTEEARWGARNAPPRRPSSKPAAESRNVPSRRAERPGVTVDRGYAAPGIVAVVAVVVAPRRYRRGGRSSSPSRLRPGGETERVTGRARRRGAGRRRLAKKPESSESSRTSRSSRSNEVDRRLARRRGDSRGSLR